MVVTLLLRANSLTISVATHSTTITNHDRPTTTDHTQLRKILGFMNTDPTTEEVNAFIDSRQSLTLSTLDKLGLPAVSYTPFCRINDAFGIYISSLSEHTQQLLDNSHLSLMWIADEQDSPNPFARQRLIAQAKAVSYPRGSKGFERISSQMTLRFPQMMQVLINLEDFQTFEIELTSCRFIKGFGKAYLSKTGCLNSFEHIGPKQ